MSKSKDSSSTPKLSIYDMPMDTLTEIIGNLSIQDRKNLALSAKELKSMVDVNKNNENIDKYFQAKYKKLTNFLVSSNMYYSTLRLLVHVPDGVPYDMLKKFPIKKGMEKVSKQEKIIGLCLAIEFDDFMSPDTMHRLWIRFAITLESEHANPIWKKNPDNSETNNVITVFEHFYDDRYPNDTEGKVDLGATEFILRLFHIFGDVRKPAVLYAEPGGRIAMNEEVKRWWYSDVINKEIVPMITDAGVPSVNITDKILPHAVINMNNIDNLDETTRFTIRLDGPFDVFILERLKEAGINWDTKKLPNFTEQVEAVSFDKKPKGTSIDDWIDHRNATKLPYSFIIHYGRKAHMLEFAVEGTETGAEEVILWENTYNRNILESVIDLFSNRTYRKVEKRKLFVSPSNDRVAKSIIKRINVICNRDDLWLMPTSYIETDTEYRGGSKRKYTKKKAMKGLPTKTITEAKLVKIRNAKEERDKNLYNKLAKVEPEEETLEQKVARQKKELRENRIR